MDGIIKFYFRAWRPVLLVFSLALITYLLYFHRLGTLLPGYSSAEVAAYHTAASWHNIANDPVNAPYSCLVWLLITLHHGQLATRAVAAGFGVLAVLAFYIIIRPWYQFRTVFLATLLFATSAGLLHAARYGSYNVLQMGVLAFVATVVWYRRRLVHPLIAGYAVAASFALLSYIPGMVWFELFGAILLWPSLRRKLQEETKLHLIGWGALFIVLISPLIIAISQDTSILLALAGLPEHLSALSHFASNAFGSIMSIGVRSNGDPLFWVGHLSLLNAVELALGIIGVYFYLYQQRSIRAMFLTGAALISLLLISFGGAVGFAILVPLLYLFIAHGLDHLLGQWLTVFPRNPIARSTGVAIICIMLFFSMLYQVRVYFVAWPHNLAARQAFHLTQ